MASKVLRIALRKEDRLGRPVVRAYRVIELVELFSLIAFFNLRIALVKIYFGAVNFARVAFTEDQLAAGRQKTTTARGSARALFHLKILTV